MAHSHKLRRSLIAVIGDARLEPESPKLKLAYEIGRGLVDHGHRVLTGGLGGIMEAACQGAKASLHYQPGDTVGILPGHDPDEANTSIDIAIASGLDHVRNSIVAHANAVIAIGGGAGTLSEMCLAWIYRRLLIGLHCEGWSGRLAGQRIDDRIRYPDIPEDRVYEAGTSQEALTIVKDKLLLYQRQHTGIRVRTTN